VVAASAPVFSYLLGQTQTIDLKSTLRETVLSRDFMTATINALDVGSVANDMLSSQLNTQLPQEIALSSADVSQIATALGPTVKQALINSADAMGDYLIGINPDFTVTVSLEPALPTVKSVVKQAFLRQLPSDLATATPAQIDQAFETYWNTAANDIPSYFVVDSSALGTGTPEALNNMVTSMQSSLTDARNNIDQANTDWTQNLNQIRPVVNIAQLVFWGLVLLILILIGGVVLIQRSVRGASRDLGITFTCYGAIFFAGTLVVRTIIGRPDFIQNLAGGNMPQTALDIVTPIVMKVTQPLFIFTLACLIIGVALLVLSFVYPKRRRTVEVTQPADKP
jgi:hypothetical protein